VVEVDENRSILNWISEVPFEQHHGMIKDARTTNTCEWLLQTGEFREWETKDSSAVLWLKSSRKIPIPSPLNLVKLSHCD
jgi:ankyrin repeat domain-containing protein 50